MSCSLVSYMISFILFAVVDQLWLLLLAMLFMGLGDAFRTGTHKAMIFEWLRREGRLDQRTRVYGYTRSWSKLGSALSALVAAGFVLATSSYTIVFWLCLIPYTAGLINILGYPANLDGPGSERTSAENPLRLSLDSVRQAFTSSSLRRILGESMLLEGVFKVVKDYLQPILQGLALPLLATSPWSGAALEPSQRGAVLIGAVFCGNFLLMSFASRSAHRLSTRLGGDEQLVRTLWWANLLVYTLIGATLLTGHPTGAVVGFIALGMIQNTFRPAQISRIDRCSSAARGATIYSHRRGTSTCI